MEEKENIEHISEEDEESFKTRSEEEDEMYLEALMKEAQGGSVSKVTLIKTEVDSSSEQGATEEESENVVPVSLPEEKIEEPEEEEEIEEPEQEAVEEELIEEELEEEALMQFPEEESFEEDENSKWEDPFEEDDSTAIKKYIFGVSLDYVDLIDRMDLDERSAFINDAINIKLEKEREDAKKYHQNSIFKHIALTIITIIVGVPLLLWVANKSIELTANNYKRMRGNFETLFTEQAKKNATIKNIQEEMQK